MSALLRSEHWQNPAPRWPARSPPSVCGLQNRQPASRTKTAPLPGCAHTAWPPLVTARARCAFPARANRCFTLCPDIIEATQEYLVLSAHLELPDTQEIGPCTHSAALPWRQKRLLRNTAGDRDVRESSRHYERVTRTKQSATPACIRHA